MQWVERTWTRALTPHFNEQDDLARPPTTEQLKCALHKRKCDFAVGDALQDTSDRLSSLHACAKPNMGSLQTISV